MWWWKKTERGKAGRGRGAGVNTRWQEEESRRPFNGKTYGDRDGMQCYLLQGALCCTSKFDTGGIYPMYMYVAILSPKHIGDPLSVCWW